MVGGPILHVLEHVPPAPASPRAHAPRHSTSASHVAPSAFGATHTPLTHRLPAAHASVHGWPVAGGGAVVHVPRSQRPLPHSTSPWHAAPARTASLH
jgi:hypothetical protein